MMSSLLRKKHQPLVPEPDVPGRWKWLVCLSSFWVNGTVLGIIYTFGITYVYMMDNLDHGSNNIAFKTALVGSLNFGLYGLFSPVASLLSHRYGIRLTGLVGVLFVVAGMFGSSFVSSIEVMYLTYSILQGFGMSLLRNMSIVITGKYFRQHLGLAIGIVSTSSSIFTVIISLILKELYPAIGFHPTLKVLSGILSLMFLCCLVWKPVYTVTVENKVASCGNDEEVAVELVEEHNAAVQGVQNGNRESEYPQVHCIIKSNTKFEADKARIVDNDSNYKSDVEHDTNHEAFKENIKNAQENKSCNLQWLTIHVKNQTTVFRNKRFIVWIISVIIGMFGFYVPSVHLVKYAKVNFPEENAELLVVLFGATSGVSRLVCGRLADLPCVNSMRMMQVAFLLHGIVTSCLPLVKLYKVLIVLTLVLGSTDGCFACIVVVQVYRLVEQRNTTQGIGWLYCGIALPITLGPALAGEAYDHLSGYDVAFYAAGATCLLSACVMNLVPRPNISSQDTIVQAETQGKNEESTE